MASTGQSTFGFAGDRIFWLLVAMGPASWILLWLLIVPVGDAPLLQRLPARVVLFGVVIVPVLEELVFRGLLQGSLLERSTFRRRLFGPITGANLLTSIVFAAMHLFSQPPLWALLVLMPSLAFGYLRERHDRLSSCIALHAFYNAGFLLLFA